MFGDFLYIYREREKHKFVLMQVSSFLLQMNKYSIIKVCKGQDTSGEGEGAVQGRDLCLMPVNELVIIKLIKKPRRTRQH